MYTKLLYYLFVMDYIYTKLQNQHHTWGNIQTEHQQNFSLLTAPSVHLERISALKPNNLISVPPDMRENRVIYSKRLNGYCRCPLGWASKLSASIQKQRLHFVLWSNPRSTRGPAAWSRAASGKLSLGFFLTESYSLGGGTFHLQISLSNGSYAHDLWPPAFFMHPRTPATQMSHGNLMKVACFVTPRKGQREPYGEERAL